VQLKPKQVAFDGLARRAFSGDAIQADKTASCVFVRMGVAPGFALKAEKV